MADDTSAHPRRNLVLIVVDQHLAQMAGHAGHPDVLTPSLDRLAESGTRFTNAYSSSPVGSTARASIASGRYLPEARTRDGKSGSRRRSGWAPALSEAGYRVTAVGDLHAGATSESGFADQRLTMQGRRAGIVGTHYSGGSGSDDGERTIDIGPGESPYSRFDRAVTAAAVGFLHEDARSDPWALMVSLAAPHLARTVPREFFDRYDERRVAAPDATHHAADWMEGGLERSCDVGRPFADEEHDRAYRASLALCTFLDARVGQLLDALDQSGQSDDTLVIYTAGHGASCGIHGEWCRDPLSEESVGVPLLIAGAGVASGRRVDIPVSHVDIAPTILQWAGIAPRRRSDGPGSSLLDLTRDRAVMARHVGEAGESLMLRMGQMKYVERAGQPPLLFDLHADGGEHTDLARDPAFRSTVTDCADRLRDLTDADGGGQDSRSALVG